MNEAVPDAGRPLPRLRELDAVRGLAALAVVFGHLALIFPAVANASRSNGLTVLDAVLYSPIDGILDGGSAVIVFFVLSGYVLSLSYRGGRQTYPGFLSRRVARLWLPYIAAVALAMVLATLLGDEIIHAASSWFNARWYGSVGISSVLEHLLLIGHFHDESQYIPVIWTLVIEMRISLIFPILLAALAVFGWRLTVLPAALLTFVAVELAAHSSGDFMTLSYIVCFIAGAALADHHEKISALMSRTTSSHRVLLLGLALLLFTYDAWMPPHLLPGPLGAVARLEGTRILLETASALIFIALARHPGRARAFLRSAIPQYLGRVSYSLYLLHTIVLLAIVHIIDPGNDGLLLALVLPMFLLSLLLADLGQRYVELPAQRLGRRLAARAEGRSPAPVTVKGAEAPL
jgi:peptidoglycan/LPS O-acetylase OafA/YrhL